MLSFIIFVVGAWLMLCIAFVAIGMPLAAWSDHRDSRAAAKQRDLTAAYRRYLDGEGPKPRFW